MPINLLKFILFSKIVFDLAFLWYCQFFVIKDGLDDENTKKNSIKLYTFKTTINCSKFYIFIVSQLSFYLNDVWFSI